METAGEGMDANTGEGVSMEYQYSPYDVDFELDPLSAILQYALSPMPEQRLAYINGIAPEAEVAESLAVAQQLWELLQRVLKQFRDIPSRGAALDQMLPVGQALKRLGATDSELQELLSTAMQIADSAGKEVLRHLAVTVYARLTLFLPEDQQAPAISSAAGRLLVSDAMPSSSSSTLVAELLATAAQGGVQLDSACVMYLKQLGNSPKFQVREDLVGCLMAVVQVLDQSMVVEDILPIFLSLCREPMWAVRRQCTLLLPLLCARLDAEDQAEVVNMFEALAHDSSVWVRDSLAGQLGHFICSLKPHLVTREMLTSLVDLSGTRRQLLGEGSNLSLACADGLSNVTRHLGVSYWPLLKPMLSRLAGSLDEQVVCRLLGCSAQLFDTLGPELWAKDVQPQVEQLLLHRLPMVKTALVENLALLLTAAPKDAHHVYVQAMHKVLVPGENGEQTGPGGNWRLRRAVAVQLGTLATIVALPHLTDFILPVALQLLADSVAAVRQAAAQQLGTCLAVLVQRGQVNWELAMATSTAPATSQDSLGIQNMTPSSSDHQSQPSTTVTPADVNPDLHSASDSPLASPHNATTDATMNASSSHVRLVEDVNDPTPAAGSEKNMPETHGNEALVDSSNRGVGVEQMSITDAAAVEDAATTSAGRDGTVGSRDPAAATAPNETTAAVTESTAEEEAVGGSFRDVGEGEGEGEPNVAAPHEPCAVATQLPGEEEAVTGASSRGMVEGGREGELTAAPPHATPAAATKSIGEREAATAEPGVSEPAVGGAEASEAEGLVTSSTDVSSDGVPLLAASRVDVVGVGNSEEECGETVDVKVSEQHNVSIPVGQDGTDGTDLAANKSSTPADAAALAVDESSTPAVAADLAVDESSTPADATDLAVDESSTPADAAITSSTLPVEEPSILVIDANTSAILSAEESAAASNDAFSPATLEEESPAPIDGPITPAASPVEESSTSADGAITPAVTPADTPPSEEPMQAAPPTMSLPTPSPPHDASPSNTTLTDASPLPLTPTEATATPAGTSILPLTPREVPTSPATPASTSILPLTPREVPTSPATPASTSILPLTPREVPILPATPGGPSLLPLSHDEATAQASTSTQSTTASTEDEQSTKDAAQLLQSMAALSLSLSTPDQAGTSQEYEPLAAEKSLLTSPFSNADAARVASDELSENTFTAAATTGDTEIEDDTYFDIEQGLPTSSRQLGSSSEARSFEFNMSGTTPRHMSTVSSSLSSIETSITSAVHDCVKHLLGMSHSQHYHHRQLFIEILSGSVNHGEVLSPLLLAMLSHAAPLGTDAVVNVRHCLASALARPEVQQLAERENVVELKAAADALRRDRNAEVAQLASGISSSEYWELKGIDPNSGS